VQNKCLSIKSRIEPLDGDRQPLVNERCFAAVTGDVADSSADVIKKLVCRLIIIIITIIIIKLLLTVRRFVTIKDFKLNLASVVTELATTS